jgi:hypothetical protein
MSKHCRCGFPSSVLGVKHRVCETEVGLEAAEVCMVLICILLTGYCNRKIHARKEGRPRCCSRYTGQYPGREEAHRDRGCSRGAARPRGGWASFPSRQSSPRTEFSDSAWVQCGQGCVQQAHNQKADGGARTPTAGAQLRPRSMCGPRAAAAVNRQPNALENRLSGDAVAHSSREWPPVGVSHVAGPGG